MIERRGENGILVLENSGVPVLDIADAIIEYFNVSKVCQRYPVSKEEVFHVIQAMADMLDNYDGAITLVNVGSLEDMQIETENVTDTMLFNVLAYGLQLEDSDDLDFLYRSGLGKIISEIFESLSKEDDDELDDSNMHRAVYDAMIVTIGKDLKEIVGEWNEEENVNNRNK